MTSISVLNARYPRAAKTLGKPVSGVRSVGHQAIFYRDAVFQIPHAMLRYRKDAIRLIAEIGMGTGALAVIGGTVVIVGFMTFSAGTLLAIQGFASLGDIGVEALTGFFAAYINVRIAAPVTAGIALAVLLAVPLGVVLARSLSVAAIGPGRGGWVGQAVRGVARMLLAVLRGRDWDLLDWPGRCCDGPLYELAAGADLVETNTFNSTSISLQRAPNSRKT